MCLRLRRFAFSLLGPSCSLCFLSIILEHGSEEFCQGVGGIVATRQHEAVKELSYRQGVILEQVGRGSVDSGGLVADLYEGVVRDVEPL